MQKIIVEQKDNGKKLITFLTSKYPNMKIATLRKALRQKDIMINGKRISKEMIISKGDEITVYISDDLLFKRHGIANKKAETVYEDKNIVIFNKPEDLEVEGENSLTEIMKSNYDFLKPCHRIDRNTTGLVVFAKNESSLHEIEKAFKEGKIEKHYIAWCYGIPEKEKELESYLFKDRKKSVVYISNEYKKGYVKIKTSYRVIKHNQENNTSLLDVTLHTGRTHQIRAHLAFEGHPIIGDGKYGSYKLNKQFRMSKQALCSYSITFKKMENGLEYLNNKTWRLKDVKFYNKINSNSKHDN